MANRTCNKTASRRLVAIFVAGLVLALFEGTFAAPVRPLRHSETSSSNELENDNERNSFRGEQVVLDGSQEDSDEEDDSTADELENAEDYPADEASSESSRPTHERRGHRKEPQREHSKHHRQHQQQSQLQKHQSSTKTSQRDKTKKKKTVPSNPPHPIRIRHQHFLSAGHNSKLTRYLQLYSKNGYNLKITANGTVEGTNEVRSDLGECT